jgi:choline-glycine betaine transporter
MSRGVAAVVFGIVGLASLGITGPIALYLGYKELHDIRMGRKSAASLGLAKAGIILGVIDVVALVMCVLSVTLFQIGLRR